MDNKIIKKRERDNDDNNIINDLMDIDNNENRIEIDNEDMSLKSSNTNEEIKVEFVFSCVKEKHFAIIKSLLQFNFQFENISLNGLTDLIIQMNTHVGTTICSSEDDDNNNILDNNVSIFGVFTVIPFNHFKSNPCVIQLKNMFLSKINSSLHINPNQKIKWSKIIENKSLSLIINERIINLPQELIPPALKMIYKEMIECIEDEDYDGRFNIDYFVIMSKFVKENEIQKTGKGKKRKKDNVELYYKYETTILLEYADFVIKYKIPYVENDMELLENKTQPQYMNVLFIKSNIYYKLITDLK